MKVYLDGQEVATERPTLGGALSAGCRAAEAAGRIVVDAELDGHPVSPELLAEPEAPAPGRELRLTTAEPRSLVLTTFLDVADAMESVKAEQSAAAELIQVGRIDEALAHLSGALSVWEQARQAVANGCALLGIPLETTVRAGAADRQVPGSQSSTPTTISHQADTLAGSLGEVKRSIEAGDWTGLADALLYDMEDRAATWREMLTDLASLVKSARLAPPPDRQGDQGREA